VKLLNYETPAPELGEDARLRWLFGAFIGATALTFAFNAYWATEPFGIFRLGDLLILVGIPLAVIGLWGVWVILALRRPRVRWFITGPVLLWAAVSIVLAWESISRYLFRQPWR